MINDYGQIGYIEKWWGGEWARFMNIVYILNKFRELNTTEN